MPHLTRDPLILDSVVAEVRGKKYGAVVTFSGTIRDRENDLPISSITYEAYEDMVEKELKKLKQEIQNSFTVALALKHRLGTVPAGESSLVVACAGVHRKEAFLACSQLIDEIKQRIPIWKVEFKE